MSISIVITHCLGDVPSPTIIGAIQDRLNNWRSVLTRKVLLVVAVEILSMTREACLELEETSLHCSIFCLLN